MTNSVISKSKLLWKICWNNKSNISTIIPSLIQQWSNPPDPVQILDIHPFYDSDSQIKSEVVNVELLSAQSYNFLEVNLREISSDIEESQFISKNNSSFTKCLFCGDPDSSYNIPLKSTIKSNCYFQHCICESCSNHLLQILLTHATEKYGSSTIIAERL